MDPGGSALLNTIALTHPAQAHEQGGGAADGSNSRRGLEAPRVHVEVQLRLLDVRPPPGHLRRHPRRHLRRRNGEFSRAVEAPSILRNEQLLLGSDRRPLAQAAGRPAAAPSRRCAGARLRHRGRQVSWCENAKSGCTSSCRTPSCVSSWGQGGQGQRGEGHREQRGKGREHGRVHPVRDHLPAADTCRHLCTAAAAAPAQSGSAGGGGLTCGVYCGVVGASPCTSLSNGIAGLLQYLKSCLEPSLTSG